MFLVPIFPLGLAGTVRVPRAAAAQGNVEPAVHRIMGMLKEMQMTSIANNGNEIDFTAPLFQPGSNWHTIIQFGSGRISVEPRDGELAIKYRLSSVKMLIGIGLMVGALGLFSVAAGNSHFDRELLVSLSIGWA